VIDRRRDSDDRARIGDRFAAITSAFRELNFSAAESADYLRLRESILVAPSQEASTS
jgi:hypothetical protein